MEYKIIMSYQPDEYVAFRELEQEVSEHIKNGYIPIGSLQRSSEHGHYFQVVYKPKEK